jgi:hypothetical protein
MGISGQYFNISLLSCLEPQLFIPSSSYSISVSFSIANILSSSCPNNETTTTGVKSCNYSSISPYPIVTNITQAVQKAA